MPLVRYEVRCEHSLANPELYRGAARDDPEGLLEGVAMAGLVGIVRQLGDLAEFAAEIFRDLHDELMTIGGRGHDLTVRVQQLEAELPAVEKALLSEPNQLRFAYTNGADWHASIRSDQNLCTSGDLPRFVRNFYEECRGPPQLFLLDKFDVAGAGACLKRYTDPSFFKLEWASSELMKAKRAQRDKKARREKKKSRRRRTGQPISALHQIPARVRYGSASLEDLDGLPQALATTLKVDVPSNLGLNNGPGMQIRRSSSSGPNVMLAEDSSLPTLRPVRVTALENGEGLSQTRKPLKISAKDIESANIPGKFYEPSEPEGIERSMAGRISKIIEMEDRDAAPSAGLFPRAADTKGFKVANGSKVSADNLPESAVESKSRNRVTREDLEAAAMARTGRTSRGTPQGTPRGSPKGEFSMNDREGRSQSGSGMVSQGRRSDASEPAPMPARAPRKGSYQGSSGNLSGKFIDINSPGRLSGKVPWRHSLDVNDGSSVGARYSRQFSMARSGSDGDEFVDAPSTMDSEGDSDFEAQTTPLGDVYRVSDMDGDAKLNHTALKQHIESQKHYIPPKVDLMEQQHSHSPLGNSMSVSQVATERMDEQLADDVIPEAPPHDHLSPVSATLNEGPPGSSASSGKSDAPAADGPVSVHQPGAQIAESHEGVSSHRISQGSTDSGSHIQPVQIVEIPEHGVEESHMLSLMATSPTVSSVGSLSSARSPALTTPGQDVLQPSMSMLSHRSYSSELMSVSSDSEPDSPFSPNSPAFNALYSPPGSPSRASRDMVDSPPGTYMVSQSPSVHYSNHSSPSLTEIPVLSLSPTSPLTSPVPVTDWDDRASPLCPPVPPPLVVPGGSEATSLLSQTRIELYPLPTPPTSPQLDQSVSPKSRDMNHLPHGGLGSSTSPNENDQEGSGSIHSNIPQQSPHSADLEYSIMSSPDAEVPSKAPTFHNELVRSTVMNSNVDPTSSLPQSTTPTPAFTDAVRSSLVLPPRPADSPGSSAPTTPVGSPKLAFQRIFLTSPSVLATPSPVGNAVEDAPTISPERDEESDPSSPTGSVIIKDTPSPPASPASSYSESGSEDHDYEASPSQPQSPMSTVSHAVEYSFTTQEPFTGEITPPRTPTSKSLHQGVPVSPVNVQQSSLASPTSDATSEHPDIVLEMVPEISLPTQVPNVSKDLEVSEEMISPPPSPPLSPQVTLHLGSPPEITKITSLPPRTSGLSDSRFKDNLVSNCLPESPPGEEAPAREDAIPNLQWLGRSIQNSPPKPEFKLPPALPVRSPSNSPPSSPPKSLHSESSSFKWRGRSDPTSPPKPNFSLPPNLVCRSESSSPPCSPPTQSEDFSKKWAAKSEHSDSSKSPAQSPDGAVDVGVGCSPELTFSPNSPTMLEKSEPSLQPPSREDSVDELDVADRHEHEMVPITRTGAGPQLASISSDESLFAVTSSKPAEAEEVHMLSLPTNLETTPITTTGLDLQPLSSSSEESLSHVTSKPCEVERVSVPSVETEAWTLPIVRMRSGQQTPSSFPEELLAGESSSMPTKPEEVHIDPATQLEGRFPPVEESVSVLPLPATSGAMDAPCNAETSQQSVPDYQQDTSLAAHSDEPSVPTSGPGFELRKTPNTKDALAAAIAQHDRNMLKVLTFQEPVLRPLPPPDERTVLLEEIRSKSFNLRRTDSIEKKEPTPRPVANINVAAILEKANAIRQAFVGSDDEDGEDDWSDS